MNGQTLTLALSLGERELNWLSIGERGFDLNAGLSGNFRQFDTIDQFIFYAYFWMNYGKDSTYKALNSAASCR